jgi:hypothetical protein
MAIIWLIYPSDNDLIYLAALKDEGNGSPDITFHGFAVLNCGYPFATLGNHADGFFAKTSLGRSADGDDTTYGAVDIDYKLNDHRSGDAVVYGGVGVVEVLTEIFVPSHVATGKPGFDHDLGECYVFCRGVRSAGLRLGFTREGRKEEGNQIQWLHISNIVSVVISCKLWVIRAPIC